MPRFTVSQKAHRVLKFTIGLRSSKVSSVLAKHGFTEADLREGLELLAAVVRKRLSSQNQREDPKLIQKLDHFEGYWFPIVRAALARHYPEVGGALMLNLGSTSGVKVAMTVSAFIERLRQMEAQAAPFGAEGAAARALLAERGLTSAVVDELVGVLAELATFTEEGESDPAAEMRAAEQAMWAWYLEWSAIARQSITNRAVLRRLGFLQSRGEDEQEVTDHEVAPLPTESSVGTVSAPQLAADNDRSEPPPALLVASA